MEIRKRFNFRIIFAGLYFLFFGVYILIGLSPAEATNYEISAELLIPKIGLESDVTTLYLKDHGLDTPEKIVGSYSRHQNKTLLIGHSTTVFKDLDLIEEGDEIIYDEDTYIVNSRGILKKEDISMNHLLLSEDSPTIIIMTCAGELYKNGDASHRLIIVASRV